MKLRVVVLVSEDTSDIYFANQIMKRFDVVGVVVEKQRIRGVRTSLASKLYKLLALPGRWARIVERVDAWQARRCWSKDREENVLHFGREGEEIINPQTCRVLCTEGCRDINKPAYVDAIRAMSPDVIAVCGTSVLKSEILSIPPRGVINLHGGLAQEYRGVWTTHWAVINEQPEYIGATVHYVNERIDCGHIIYQGRPMLDVSDNPATLYIKVVKLGIEMMAQALLDIQNEAVRSYPLTQKGKLYREHMMTNRMFRMAWKKSERGLLYQYLQDKATRDAKVDSIIQGDYVKLRPSRPEIMTTAV